MADYGHDLLFGIFPTPTAADPDRVIALAQLAEQASLDLVTGGRVELGLGAGAFWDAIEANAGPRRSPGEAVEALAEAIGVIRALWDTGTPGGARIPGEHYPLAGAKRGPAPAHDMGIWLGSIKPRMLRLTGRVADGWLPSAPYVPPDQLGQANEIIEEAAVS